MSEMRLQVERRRGMRVRIVHETGGFRRSQGDVTNQPCPTILATVRQAADLSVRVVYDTGGYTRNKEVTNLPCPTITIGDLTGGGGDSAHWKVHVDDQPQIELRRDDARP